MRRRRSLLIAATGTLALAAAAAFAIPAAVEWRVQARLDLAREQMRAYATAIAAMGVDNCGLYAPPDDSGRYSAGSPPGHITFLTSATANAEGRLAIAQNHSKYRLPVDAPIPYTREIHRDPFSLQQTYGYVAVTEEEGVLPHLAAVRSVGPNGVADIDLHAVKRLIDEHARVPRSDEFRARRSNFAADIRDLIHDSIYDPTNGVSSRGDLIHIYYGGSPEYGWHLDNSEYATAQRAYAEAAD